MAEDSGRGGLWGVAGHRVRLYGEQQIAPQRRALVFSGIMNDVTLRNVVWILILAAGAGLVAFAFARRSEAPPSPQTPETPNGTPQIIAEGLVIPWEVVLLPDGDLLVTERPGTLKRIGKDKRVYTIEGVEHVGEGGLLGMALHQRFGENHWLYLYLTTAAGDGLVNRVERYRLAGDQLFEKTIIIDNIPGAVYHDGGRIAFGPDGYLYITTGDATRPNLAQDTTSLAGKILRLKDDGSIPWDNPFASTASAQAAAVWSYGHRNSQGLAWDEQGRLWATEHGRSGLLSGFDELNLIEEGKNYGWSVIQGSQKKEGMESPVLQSGPDITWAPAGAAYANGSIFFGGLRGEALYEARIVGERRVELKTHFHKEFGRLRAVVLAPDGFLYITTSNTDDRGEPRAGDDKVIRIDPAQIR